MDEKRAGCHAIGMRFLKKIRESEGLSMYAMAKRLGVLDRTYHYYEESAQGMKFAVLVDLKEKLNLTWDELGKLIEIEVSENRKVKK